MSYRGSLVSEYIYCDKCFELLKNKLLTLSEECDWNFRAVQVPNTNVIAARVRSSSSELLFLVEQLTEAFNTDNKSCHPINLYLIAEGNDPIKITIDDGYVDYE